MLKDNKEFKIRQQEENRKEKEQDIKFMEEYTRIIEKQEQDRADYFKKCENRQKETKKKMADTVIKEKDMKMKEDEDKMIRYQMEKDRKYLIFMINIGMMKKMQGGKELLNKIKII